VTTAYEAGKPTTGLDLTTVPQALLAAINTYFATNGVQLPDRQMVTAADPTLVAWDCPQVVVTLADVGWGRSPDATQLSPSFGKQASVNAMRHVTYAALITRPYPTIGDDAELPSVDAIEQAGAVTALDMGLLSQCLVNFVAFHNPALPIGGSAQAGAVQVIGPEGGLIGCQGALIVTAGALLPTPTTGEIPSHLAHTLRNGSPGG
jgi:hypothetical protein